MTKKIIFCIAVVLIFTLSLIPVSAQETQTLEQITVTDDLEREVKIPVPVTSIVTLAPSLTETLYFLDAIDLLKGCDVYSDYPEEVSKLDRVTNWDMSLNYEALTAAEPDLVLTAEINGTDITDRLLYKKSSHFR